MRVVIGLSVSDEVWSCCNYMRASAHPFAYGTHIPRLLMSKTEVANGPKIVMFNNDKV